MSPWLPIGFLFAGGVVVAALAWLLFRAKEAARVAAAVSEAQHPLQTELATLRERASRIAVLEAALHTSEQEREALSREAAVLEQRLQAAERAAAEKLALLEEAGEKLTNQFRALAGEILEEKSKRFTEQNQTNLNGLLDPLRSKLKEFQDKVEQVHVDGVRERSALSEQVRQLVALNQTLSADAKNLTSALKGSSKTQGTWGELVLERILEAAGLQKGREYVVQERQATDDGRRLQPDVVVNLPEERYLVVDSKVSLIAYERCASAESEGERASALGQHLASVRKHVRELSARNYQSLYGLQSLDCVLLFVPIEPAFMLAIANDGALFMDAWERNVLLVSPSTLLFVLRTVAHLWRQEAQSRNAQEIASRGAELYDKLVGFVEDLRRIGGQLKSAQVAYDEAQRKLCEGRGNAIRQAEMLRELGIKPTKRLPRALVERAVDADSPGLLAGSNDEAVDDPPDSDGAKVIPISS